MNRDHLKICMNLNQIYYNLMLLETDSGFSIFYKKNILKINLIQQNGFEIFKF